MQDNTLTTNKFLSESEDQAFLNRLNSMPCRNGLMLTLLRYLGCRAGELLSLRICDLNPFEKSVRITASKGSKNREIPLPQALYDRLDAYAKSTQRSDYQLIFVLSYNQLGEIWRSVRPIGCGKKLHSLRHTRAIELYRSTKDILLVKAWLGHKSLQTTMIYQEFDYTQSAFRLGASVGIIRETAPLRALQPDDNPQQRRNF